MAQLQPVQTILETFDTEVADQEDTVNLEAWFKSTERLARLGKIVYGGNKNRPQVKRFVSDNNC